MKASVLACVAAVGLVGVPATSSAQGTAPTPTFSKDVAPIFYQNCVVCHREGEIAPMSLLTYKQARPFARSIAAQVTQGTMPPWHADPKYGKFENDRRLTEKDKATILAWVNGGTPEGNPAELPTAPVFPDGWAIGKVDAVFELPENYPVPAEGTIDYKYFEVPTNFTEDKWIQAFQVKPGDPSAVHHVIVFSRPPKRPAPAGAPQTDGAQRQRQQGPFTFGPNMDEPESVKANAARQSTPNDRPAPKDGMGGFVGGFAPGQAIRIFREGTAVRLPAGSTLIFQMHYTATGKATTDRSKIGLVFAKEPPKQEMITAALVNQNFTLPAGAPDTKVDATMTMNTDVTLWSVMPHTHVRGRRWEVKATYPDGRTEMLVNVPKYDFNWQTEYVFDTPIKLPKGTVFHTSAWYDNSAASKTNPNPKIDVHWGEQTWEEMQFTAFSVTIDPPSKPTTAGQP
jgi:hypothetical protein